MGKQLTITDNGVFVIGSKAFLTVDGVHRKALKMYRTTDGVHRLCFSSGLDVSTMGISYTGNMTDEIVTMSGAQYRLLTLTSSGTLTIDEEVDAEVWLCDGGNAGGQADVGGGGGYFIATAITLPRSATAIIGAGGVDKSGIDYPWRGGDTSFAGIITQRYPSERKDGASGGGEQWDRGYGNGDGKTTCPFGDQIYFSYSSHCAGGGGGGYLEIYGDDYYGYEGGEGGSNGANGYYSYSRDGEVWIEGGQGGSKGGGGGGSAEWYIDWPYAGDGGDAYFYGSGGGGGGQVEVYDSDGNWVDFSQGIGGAGYQGVIYVRIPLVRLITFTLFDLVDKTHKAEEGMTWAQWLSSPLNTGVSYYVEGDLIRHAYSNYYLVVSGTTNRVKASDVITPDGRYGRHAFF